MRKALTTTMLALAFAASLTAQVTIPYSFTSGTIIDPDQMNANFTAVAAACNRTGCTMTGVLKAVAGTAGAPGIANSTDATTGIVIGTSGTIGWSLSGTQRMLLNSSGLTVFGTVVANGSGQLVATTLTGLVPAASLGSGSATSGTFLRGDRSWASIGACTPTVVSKVALYTAALCEMVEANGTFTVTLPAASSAVNGSTNIVDVKNTGTGTITVTRAGADTIDGATSYSLAVQYQTVTLVANAAGNGWDIR